LAVNGNVVEIVDKNELSYENRTQKRIKEGFRVSSVKIALFAPNDEVCKGKLVAVRVRSGVVLDQCCFQAGSAER
jgi:hypothetical protein